MASAVPKLGPVEDLSWRMDETYVRTEDVWKYADRAVDKVGATVDFLLTAKRDRKAARSYHELPHC